MPALEERVGAELLLDPLDRRPGVAQAVEGGGVAAQRPQVDRRAATRGLGLVAVVPDRDRHEVRRRGLGEVERRDGVVADLLVGGHRAVGDAGPGSRHPDGEVVERLVGGLVVDGVPGVGAERLLHRPDLVPLGDGPAAGAEVAAGGRGRHRLRGAGVGDLDGVAAVLGDLGADDEVLAEVVEGHRLAVELDRGHLERGPEVEPEGVGVGRGAEGQGGDARERVGVGVPGEVEVVVQGVHARVADPRVVGVLPRLALRHGQRLVLGVDARVGQRRARRRGGAGLGGGVRPAAQPPGGAGDQRQHHDGRQQQPLAHRSSLAIRATCFSSSPRWPTST